MTLEGRSAIVTGGGRGIGRAIALSLAKEGANVTVVGRTVGEIDQVAESIRAMGRDALAVNADVSSESDVGVMVGRALEHFGSVDVLVNNAGIGIFSKVADMTPADFDRMFATNVRGVFLCTKALLPSMILRRSGDIVNIASLAGRNAFVGGAGYGATKWALIGFARSLMLEVREYDIRVITICPGSVDTSFDQRSGAERKDPHRMPSAEDIAQVVLGALRMPRNVMVSEIDVRPTNPTWKA